ncbi:hypothetical protein HY387_00385 [Candidatus Daviesbacteria bacterium]|nr:hypothetical protein [Candidatus Daviesbacteria bacterium]
MISKNISKHPKSLVEVEVSVPWADLEPKWNETLQRLTQDMEQPGFRKGQVPLNMAENSLGVKLQDEALKDAMPVFLIEALKGTDIVPIDFPKYQVTSFVKGQGLVYKASVTNRPTVTVGNYKTIRVTRPPLKPITEEEVNKVIDDLYKRWKTRLPAEQAKQPSDKPVNQAGSINFQPNGQTLGPDDNFAKAMGAISLTELKMKIRKDLENHNSFNNELDFEEAILQEVEKITTVELPDILIEDDLNRMLVSLQRRVSDTGLLMEDYLRSQGKTLEQLRREWKPQAEKNVRMELGLAEIARMENVTISDQELQAEIDKIQDARVKQQFEVEEPRLHLRHALRQTRTLNLLKNLVVV